MGFASTFQLRMVLKVKQEADYWLNDIDDNDFIEQEVIENEMKWNKMVTFNDKSL